jgi:hypothetical protein
MENLREREQQVGWQCYTTWRSSSQTLKPRHTVSPVTEKIVLPDTVTWLVLLTPHANVKIYNI